MNKKVVLFGLIMLFFLSFVLAQEVCEEGDDDCKVDNAYACLNEKIDDKTCSGLSPEEKIFSFLATEKCKAELISDSRFKSDLKYTSQAVLGLKGNDLSDAESWLLSQNRTSTGLEWFLQIESPEATSCTITYSNSNTLSINEDKKINSLSGGSCFTISDNGYWLEVNQLCFGQEFEISCNQQFLTTLLYKKQDSDTIYVSELTHSSSAQGTTAEKVNSFCFRQGASCSYEGSLWAALSLDFLGNDISAYLPYLIVTAEDNPDVLPESFLYYLTGEIDYKNKLLGKQINSKWWLFSGDRYYGTSVALYPFQHDIISQKTDSIDWLLNEVQGADGCWDSGNIRNTAFLLYSIWPDNVAGSIGDDSGTGIIDCVASGYYCASQINCNGQVLSDYSCTGAFVCCSEQQALNTCFNQGGEICASNQVCAGIGSAEVSASDISSGQICCVNGFCQVPSSDSGSGITSACKSTGGICRINGCLSGETETSASCDFSSDICCVSDSTSKPESKLNYLWIWIILALIIVVVLGIIFRNKLRSLLFRMKSKSGGDSGSQYNEAGFRRGPPGFPPLQPSQRRIIPGQVHHRPPIKAPKSRAQSEVDEVLRKLKEMSK